MIREPVWTCPVCAATYNPPDRDPDPRCMFDGAALEREGDDEDTA